MGAQGFPSFERGRSARHRHERRRRRQAGRRGTGCFAPVAIDLVRARAVATHPALLQEASEAPGRQQYAPIAVHAPLCIAYSAK